MSAASTSTTLKTSQSSGTLYGLPEQVLFCKRCVISNQRPNSVVEYGHTASSTKPTIHFDADGICDACRFAEQKAKVDWTERDRQLRDLCDTYRKPHGYDCVVPGSGGKDSFYAAHILRTKYGMHPLTVTWAPHIYTKWGWRNFQRWVERCGDNYLFTPRTSVHRLLTRIAVERLFHPFQPFIIGQKSFAPKIAEKLKIPLVFYGENEAEYGNPIGDTMSPLRSMSYWTAGEENMYLSGASIPELKKDHGLTKHDLEPYFPSSLDNLLTTGVQVHYLGYYLEWHPQSAYYYAVEHGGFESAPERTPGTYSRYSSIDDKADDWHYLTTFYKFGIGRATYDAAQEIRNGDITREEGVALVERYDGEWPHRYEEEMNEYLSPPGFPQMTRDTWWELIEKFKSPHLFDENNKLRHAVWMPTQDFGAK